MISLTFLSDRTLYLSFTILKPPQILNLAHSKSEIERRVHAVIDKFAERGLRSLAVAYQVMGSLFFLIILLHRETCVCNSSSILLIVLLNMYAIGSA